MFIKKLFSAVLCNLINLSLASLCDYIQVHVHVSIQGNSNILTSVYTKNFPVQVTMLNVLNAVHVFVWLTEYK